MSARQTGARDGRPVVVVTRRLPQRVEDALLERYDARLNTLDQPLGEAELRDAVRQADALLCTVTDRVTREVLTAAPRRSRLVVNFGVGVNHIDLAAAREAGIVVTNTPGVLTDDTADLAIALLLAVARRTGEGERLVRAGAWPGWAPTQLLGTRVSGKTLGIVGYGRIGRAVAQRARHGFGMRVLVHSRRPAAGEGTTAEIEWRAELDDLLVESDFVSLHCPATPDTRHLIDGGRLRRMQRTAYLVNTARGDVVDERALADALHAGTIAGAGLDVYEREPAVWPALLNAPNVVLLPHLGSATAETREAMGLRALANLDAFFGDGEPPDRVA
ncbi:MAG TPA: D-glycerate dehydrogenase [Gemmatimonadaceae bacterium]|nr:D-glycerate dehydrogenase [Gemmatimonadaceae bacterium]